MQQESIYKLSPEFEGLVPKLGKGDEIIFKLLDQRENRLTMKAYVEVFDHVAQERKVLCVPESLQQRLFKDAKFTNGVLSIRKGEEEMLRFLSLHPRCEGSPFASNDRPSVFRMVRVSDLIKESHKNDYAVARASWAVSRVLSPVELQKVAQEVVLDTNLLQSYTEERLLEIALEYAKKNPYEVVSKYKKTDLDKAFHAVITLESQGTLSFKEGAWLDSRGVEIYKIRLGKDEEIKTASSRAYKEFVEYIVSNEGNSIKKLLGIAAKD